MGTISEALQIAAVLVVLVTALVGLATWFINTRLNSLKKDVRADIQELKASVKAWTQGLLDEKYMSKEAGRVLEVRIEYLEGKSG